jgi:putative ABC transport system permease protein
VSGVELATKVFRTKGGSAQAGGQWAENVNVMGIIPDEFSKVTWFRSGLLPYHINRYLDLLADAPTAFLVSRSFGEDFKVKEGDEISIKWGDQDYLEGTIYAFVDYWPTFNPNVTQKGEKKPYLVVANLSYIQSELAMEPYEVWIKKKPGATNAQIYNNIEKKELKVDSIENTGQKLIDKKNDPMLQGTNGAMTMDFIFTMVISIIGFLIYWILSIQQRTLQFGLLRAMGLSAKKVIGMISCEQVLISGSAIIMGIVIGGITGKLFVPLLQLTYSSAEQVPPFKVISYAGDYIKLYTVAAVMLLAGFAVLGTLISKIKISQAIKLGED